MPEKVDLKRSDRGYYTATPTPSLVDLAPISCLSLEGRGEPAGDAFLEATRALYTLAYGVKKVCRSRGQDFSVPSLEGLWWVDGGRPASEVPRDQWSWKLLIRMPDFVTEEGVAAAKADAEGRGKRKAVDGVRFETIAEGRCAQVLHVGPYATEPGTIDALLHFIEAHHLAVAGPHHEIYLSDPRRTRPERRKTIIRYPVR